MLRARTGVCTDGAYTGTQGPLRVVKDCAVLCPDKKYKSQHEELAGCGFPLEPK